MDDVMFVIWLTGCCRRGGGGGHHHGGGGGYNAPPPAYYGGESTTIVNNYYVNDNNDGGNFEVRLLPHQLIPWLNKKEQQICQVLGCFGWVGMRHAAATH
jgi:hypothetical protein